MREKELLPLTSDGHLHTTLKEIHLHFKSQHWSHVAPQCQRLSQFLQHEVPRKDEIQNKCQGRKDMLQNIWEKELHTRSLFIKVNTYSVEAYLSFWSMKCQGRIRCKICEKEGRTCETEESIWYKICEKKCFSPYKWWISMHCIKRKLFTQVSTEAMWSHSAEI